MTKNKWVTAENKAVHSTVQHENENKNKKTNDGNKIKLFTFARNTATTEELKSNIRCDVPCIKSHAVRLYVCIGVQCTYIHICMCMSTCCYCAIAIAIAIAYHFCHRMHIIFTVLFLPLTLSRTLFLAFIHSMSV